MGSTWEISVSSVQLTEISPRPRRDDAHLDLACLVQIPYLGLAGERQSAFRPAKSSFAVRHDG